MAQDFNKFCQLVLLEEFKSCLTPQMKTYLNKQKVDGLSQAAVLVDVYSLMHKSTFAKPELEPGGGRNGTQGKQSTTGSYNNMDGQRLRSGNVERSQINSGGGTRRSNVLVGFYCKQSHHV